jgi:hypothetical protein
VVDTGCNGILSEGIEYGWKVGGVTDRSHEVLISQNESAGIPFPTSQSPLILAVQILTP